MIVRRLAEFHRIQCDSLHALCNVALAAATENFSNHNSNFPCHQLCSHVNFCDYVVILAILLLFACASVSSYGIEHLAMLLYFFCLSRAFLCYSCSFRAPFWN